MHSSHRELVAPQSIEESMAARVRSYLQRGRRDSRRVLRVGRIQDHRVVMRHVTAEWTGAPEWWAAEVGPGGLGRGLWFAGFSTYLWRPRAGLLLTSGAFGDMVGDMRRAGAGYLLQAECMRSMSLNAAGRGATQIDR